MVARRMALAADCQQAKRRGRIVSMSKRKLNILHIALSIGETNACYNQFCLPMVKQRNITICTYFESDIAPHEAITLFEGNNSLTGFMRVLNAALAEKEYDVIHAHSPHVALLFLLGTLPVHRRLAPSTVVTVHDSYQNFKWRNRLMFIPVFASFRRVVCCGKASYDSFPALYKWLAGDRLRAVQNGLDITRVDRIAASNRQRPVPKEDFTVTAISRLVEIKNPHSVLSAFQQSNGQANQTSRLVYIGAGPLRDSLLAQRKELGLENHVELTGLIPREKVFEHLLAADLFISASRGEGLPVAVLEAMACGCPVLLSDIPPHREIADGVGFVPLVPPDDVAGFAQEIGKFREMPASERTNIGQKCRELVEERFSLQAMHAGYKRIYAELVDDDVELFEGIG